MVARANRHTHTGSLSPVDSLAYDKHYAVLGRWLGGSGWDDEAGFAHAFGLEFLDDNSIEEGPESLACQDRKPTGYVAPIVPVRRGCRPGVVSELNTMMLPTSGR